MFDKLGNLTNKRDRQKVRSYVKISTLCVSFLAKQTNFAEKKFGQRYQS